MTDRNRDWPPGTAVAIVMALTLCAAVAGIAWILI